MSSTKRGYLYIVTNKMRTVFYTGVTSALKERAWQHHTGSGSAFTRRYNLKYLVYYEEYTTILEAIQREKQIKNWRRDWKLDLILKINPDLRDLWYDL